MREVGGGKHYPSQLLAKLTLLAVFNKRQIDSRYGTIQCTCASVYIRPRVQSMWPELAAASDTAGFTCPPDTNLMEYTESVASNPKIGLLLEFIELAPHSIGASYSSMSMDKCACMIDDEQGTDRASCQLTYGRQREADLQRLDARMTGGQQLEQGGAHHLRRQGYHQACVHARTSPPPRRRGRGRVCAVAL